MGYTSSSPHTFKTFKSINNTLSRASVCKNGRVLNDLKWFLYGVEAL